MEATRHRIGPALAEDGPSPKCIEPTTLCISIGVGTVTLVFSDYSTLTGIHFDVPSIGMSPVPFLTVADRYRGSAAVVA